MKKILWESQFTRMLYKEKVVKQRDWHAWYSLKFTCNWHNDMMQVWMETDIQRHHGQERDDIESLNWAQWILMFYEEREINQDVKSLTLGTALMKIRKNAVYSKNYSCLSMVVGAIYRDIFIIPSWPNWAAQMTYLTDDHSNNEQY